MATVTVRKWGNSLAVRIPQEVSELAKFKDGVEIDMFVTDNGEVVLKTTYPAQNDQKSLRKHLLTLRAKSKAAGINPHPEMFADPVGDEII